MNMKIVCVGAGYVGCVTGTSFAALGYETTLIDIDVNKVKLIREGRSPIYEPGLEYLIQQTIGKTLFASTDYQSIKEADIVFIAVETPSGPDGCADLKYVKAAACSIAKNLNKYNFTLVVCKSTVPTGTGQLVSSIISEISGLAPEKDFAQVSNPEFLREGCALQDVFFPDRIVVGTDNLRARNKMKSLYRPIISSTDYPELIERCLNYNKKMMGKPTSYFETDVKTAELIKYASNAFLAVKISYINEIAKLCEKLGTNVLDVAKGMGLDSRIGSKFLEVSSGWQGSCFPKDTCELYFTSEKYGCGLSVVKAAIDANMAMHGYVVEKIRNYLGCLNGKTIAILGLTFKPDTDDARKTQAQYIIPQLLGLGAIVRVFDPQGMEAFKRNNEELEITYCEKAEQVAHKADCLLLLTHWSQFKELDWKEMVNNMNTAYVLDTRNFISKELEDLEVCYQGLGVK